VSRSDPLWDDERLVLVVSRAAWWC
jgi:hypothetical protein